MDLHEVAAARQTSLRYAGAVAAAVAAAVVIGLAWIGVVGVFNRWSGVPAAALGAAVGYAVLAGSGQQRGWRLQAISVAVALAGMLAATGLAMRLLATRATEELARFGITHVPLALPLRTYWNLIVESFTADVTTLVFFGLGLWMALALPRRYETYG